MRWEDRQKRVEEKVYDTIDEIADEIGLDVPCYPEVYWVGRRKDLGFLGLSQQISDVGTSLYDNSCNVILIRDEHRYDIAEESSHFLHWVNSGLDTALVPDDSVNTLSLFTWIEMLGFLGSKFVCPERFANYQGKDMFLMDPKKRDRKLAQIARKYGSEISDEFFKYQQAMGVADRIYHSYIQGHTSLDFIRDLFKEHFSKVTPLEAFCFVKFKYWPPEKKDIQERLIPEICK